jgi:hypothetical protein
MKFRFVLLLTAIGCSATVFSQQRLIVCNSEQNPDKSISIYAESQAFGEYTVKLVFTSLSGYTSTVNTDVALITVPRGRTQIAKLTPDRSAAMYSMNFTSQYFPGVALRKAPDSLFAHLLPGTEGKEMMVSKVRSLSEAIGKQSPEDYYATGFQYQLGDTICATRAGVIYETSDEVNEGEKKNQFFKSQRNRIGLQHKDGTIGQYSILSPIKLLVNPGDNVIPGQPLAVFNKPGEKYTMLFSVIYLNEKKAYANSNFGASQATTPFNTVAVNFYDSENKKGILLASNNRYLIVHPKEIIGLELSKKDKKKLGFQ